MPSTLLRLGARKLRTVDDAEGVQGAAEVAVPRRGFIWPTESFKHPAYPVTFVAGGRYRSTGTSIAHLPPSVSEVDVYTACERGCYFHHPRDDIVYFDTPRGSSHMKWERIGAVDFDATIVKRMIHDTRGERSKVLPSFKNEVLASLKRLQALRAV